ncbi:MAG: hypothetical protein AVDCRST_MAG03-2947, partial [uncultured Rubrobacteraceae bacterium]
DRSFVPLRCRPLGDRRLPAGRGQRLPLLDMPAIRRPVGLLRAGAGARAPLRSTHRRLRVGRQDPRDASLWGVRVRLALGRLRSGGRLDGRQRTPDGPGGPDGRPRAILPRAV